MAGKILQGPPFSPTITGKTIGEFLFESATKHGERICQTDPMTDKTETFHSIKQRSIRVALELSKIGVTSKDIVVTCCSNSLDNFIPVIATTFLYAKVASLDPSQSVSQIKHLLKITMPSVIFVDEAAVKLIEDSLLGEDFSTTTIVVVGESTKYATLNDYQKSKDKENDFRPCTGECNEIAFLIFSSGTQGLPKAICHSHKTILNWVFPINFPSTNLYYTTMYWLSGILTLVNTFHQGANRIVARDFDAEETFRIIEKYKVNTVGSTGANAYKLTSVKNPERFDTSSLISLGFGGTFLSAAQIEKTRSIFKTASVQNAYGCTETGVIALFKPQIEKEREKMISKPDAAGFVYSGVTLKIVDPDTDQLLGPNEKGEIRVKTPRQMLGYYKQDSSGAFDDDGFLKTGDIGYYDEDGCLYIVERIKEMFKYQSWHIVPSSIEAEILKHPAVAEAVVIGIPNEENGHIPAACVVLRENMKATPEEIQEFVAANVLDRERLRGGMAIVDKLPKTPTAKIIRREAYRLFLHKFLAK